MTDCTKVVPASTNRRFGKCVTPIALVMAIWIASAVFKAQGGETKKEPLSKIVIDLHGYPEASYWGAFHHAFAFTQNGRWIAVPLDTTRRELRTTLNDAGPDRETIDGRAIFRGKWSEIHVASSSVHLVDLQGPKDHERPCWDVQHLPVTIVAGPHNTIAFQIEQPQMKLFHLKDRSVDVVLQRARYVRVIWCGAGKSAFYRLPQADTTSVRVLWFADNAATGDPSLFAILWDGTICRWPLENRGMAPQVHELVVERLPKTVSVYDLLSGADKTWKRNPRDDYRIDVSAKNHTLAYLDAGNPSRIRVISFAKSNVKEMENPDTTMPIAFRDILLSPDGKFCVGISRHRLYAWETDTGKVAWSSQVDNGHFIHRCSISDDGSHLVTWSLPFAEGKAQPGHLDQYPNTAETKLARNGVLTRFDAMTGAIRGSLAFPATGLLAGVRIGPDGRRLAVLDGGRLTLLDVAILKGEGK